MNRHFLNFIVLTAFIGLVFLVSCSGEKAAEQKESQASAQQSTVMEKPEEVKVVEKKAVPPLPVPDTSPINFIEQKIFHPNGDTFNLYLPEGFIIKPVAWGMKRIRFMDLSPDGRLFLTDMYNLEDNTKGKIYILDGWNDSSMTFTQKTVFAEQLRNPNSLAFYKDSKGKDWLYVAFTDKLVRYPYTEGMEKPEAAPEVLDTYPDYGLSYRYGGWHLTRTIQFGDNGKLYVSIGSSCNTCIEKEEVRASILEMDPDGKNRRIYAKGVRNAVGLAWAKGSLYASNMAADHLGKDKPDDAMFLIEDGNNYGWPYCYHWQGKVYDDPKYDTSKTKISAKSVPGAFSYFGAHTAPLGLAWFGEDKADDNTLKNYFLVAQHGSYNPSMGMGYSVQRIRANTPPEDFIKGFLDGKGKIHGRPCGIYALGNNRFYLTDDKFGTLYLVFKEIE